MNQITLSESVVQHMLHRYWSDPAFYKYNITEYYQLAGWDLQLVRTVREATFTLPENQVDFFLLSL